MAETSPEGYEVTAVETWATQHVPELAPPFKWTRLIGGHSNLTYQIEDTEGKLAVIRRPPRGELLPKAHDMSREWSLISALHGTDVPVPEPLGFCEDPEITGAWFYIMGFVDGHPFHNAVDVHTYLPEHKRAQFADSFIEKLAALHALDPDEIGLGQLGKKEGYVARQLKTWYRSWTSSAGPAQFDDPRAHELQRFFLENMPEQGKARVVHGDFGPHNTLVGPDGLVAAVIDWEISTLGDPLADVAYALNQWRPEVPIRPADPDSVSAQPGFPSREYLAKRYGELTGQDLSHLDFYLGFNRWKTSAIVHGVYAGYMEDKKSTDGVDLEKLQRDIVNGLDDAEIIVNRL